MQAAKQEGFGKMCFLKGVVLSVLKGKGLMPNSLAFSTKGSVFEKAG